jgi:Ca-activated chloride channel family protein
MRSAHDIGLSVELDAGVPIHGVRSPSHQLETSAASRHEAGVKIAAGDTIPNKDFILRYDVAGDDKPEFAVIPHRGADAKPGSFFLMAQPPVDAEAAQVTAKEMVFVVDTSSSMQGKPLDKAKEAIRRAIAGMGADDTFQIIRFDDRASALGAAPIANKPKNVDIALSWLAALEAGGGTDMTTGIRAALAFPHDPARLRIVVFLTDGFIGNEDEILALVQDQLGTSRLFSFGVGSAVNRWLLEEMASLGRGTVQVVRPDEDTTAAVDKFHARIAKPLLTDVAIDWNGLAVEGVTPARIPDLFAGQPLILSGRYAAAGNAVITVKGKLAGRDVSFDVPVTLPETRERAAVAAIWARGRITELSRQQLRGEQPELKQQIIDLALGHRLMSQYTAFVAVDTTKVTEGGKAETVAVPVAIPEGLRSTQGDYGGSGGGAVYGVTGESAGYGAMGVGSYGASVTKTTYPMQLKAADMASGVDDRDVYGGLLGREAEELPARGDPAGAPAPAPTPPTIAKPEPKPKLEPPPPEHADTSELKMRVDVDKCWKVAMTQEDKGTVAVSVDFDDVGAPRSIAVAGVTDKALGDCVRSMAKKWRSLKKKNNRLELTVVK